MDEKINSKSAVSQAAYKNDRKVSLFFPTRERDVMHKKTNKTSWKAELVNNEISENKGETEKRTP